MRRCHATVLCRRVVRRHGSSPKHTQLLERRVAAELQVQRKQRVQRLGQPGSAAAGAGSSTRDGRRRQVQHCQHHAGKGVHIHLLRVHRQASGWPVGCILANQLELAPARSGSPLPFPLRLPAAASGHVATLTCRGSGSALPCSCACASGLQACISASRSGGAGASVAAEAASCMSEDRPWLRGLDCQGAALGRPATAHVLARSIKLGQTGVDMHSVPVQLWKALTPGAGPPPVGSSHPAAAACAPGMPTSPVAAGRPRSLPHCPCRRFASAAGGAAAGPQRPGLTAAGPAHPGRSVPESRARRRAVAAL